MKQLSSATSTYTSNPENVTGNRSKHASPPGIGPRCFPPSPLSCSAVCSRAVVPTLYFPFSPILLFLPFSSGTASVSVRRFPHQCISTHFQQWDCCSHSRRKRNEVFELVFQPGSSLSFSDSSLPMCPTNTMNTFLELERHWLKMASKVSLNIWLFVEIVDKNTSSVSKGAKT